MSDAVDRLVDVVEALRDHCPWTRALTHGSLTEYLVEEAYEAVEEIGARTDAQWSDTSARRADGSYAALAGELGDVLFQVVLHAAVSRAPGAPRVTAGFSVDDAADALTAKMIRRNPLVLRPDGSLRPAEELAAVTPEAVELAWERVKAAERAAAGGGPSDDEARADDAARVDDARRVDDAGPADGADARGGADPGARGAETTPDVDFGGIPAHLPALAAAAAVTDRAGRQAVDPLAAALGEVDADGAPWEDEAALGAELFALVRRARAAGLDPERALRGVVADVRAGRWDEVAARASSPRRPHRLT